MTPNQLWGWIVLGLILLTVAAAVWEIFCGVRWLVRKIRAWWQWRQFVRHHGSLNRITG